MNKKDKFNLIIMTSSLFILFLVLIFLFCFLTKNVYGAILGIIVSFLITTVIMIFTYPIIFKDYIEEFWRKEEEKNVQKEKQEY